MPQTFFTSDHHFGHNAIIPFCARPFASVAEMDKQLVERWNEVVAAEDTVWHLGDFAKGLAAGQAAAIFGRLNGFKHLIVGNHDAADTLALDWASVTDRAFITVDGQELCLDHYPGRCWSGSYRGVIQLFGHSHGRMPNLGNAADVGVDCWAYRPVTLGAIMQAISSLAPAQFELSGDPLDPAILKRQRDRP